MRLALTCILVAILSATDEAQIAIERAPDGYAKNMRAIHATVMRLRAGIQDKDFDAVGKEASNLKSLLRNTQTFWEDRRALNAVNRSRAAHDAAEMLLTASQSKDFSRLLKGHHALTSSCVGCHIERRDRLPDGSYVIK